MIRIKLKEVLKKKDMTMVELSELSGVTQSTLGLFANGKSNGIQFTTLDRILSALQVDVGEIIEHIPKTFNISVQLEEVIKDYNSNSFFRYKIIATDKETNEIHKAVLTFSCSESELDKRKTIFISYKKRNHEDEIPFTHDRLQFLLFTQKDKSVLTILSYLITADLIKKLNITNLDIRSLVFFSWNGFIPHESGEPIFILDLNKSNNETVALDIPSLQHLDLVDSVNHNLKLDEYNVDIYIK